LAGIRTAMVTTPALLADLIKALASGRRELEIVAEFGERRGLARRLQQLRPDLVIIGLRRAETDAIVTTLLALLPRARFVVFAPDGRRVTGYRLRLTKTELSDASPDAFIGFVGPVDAATDDWS